MKRTQRLLGVLVVLVMLLASLGSVAVAQDQGNQSGTSTQTGGGRVVPPSNNNPDPAPAPDPAPEPSNPPSSNPSPQPSQPSNGAQGGSQSGTSNSTGSQGPGVSNPEPSNPPSGGTGGGSGPITIEVNLSRQALYVYQGGALLDSTLVGTGKPGFDTPTGTFYINSKYRYDDMSGREGGESWDVRAVPYAMYFTGSGHALHGAPWRSSFGYVGSHGCVGMPVGFAGWLYSIAPIGTPVYIHY